MDILQLRSPLRNTLREDNKGKHRPVNPPERIEPMQTRAARKARQQDHVKR